MDNVAPCPNCQGKTLYRSPEISSGGGHAPNYLPGLGRFVFSAKFVARRVPRLRPHAVLRAARGEGEAEGVREVERLV